MRVRCVRAWRRESWTRLCEAALFERDTLRLWTRIWKAQLAILERENQIRRSPTMDAREKIALRKAQAVLQDLRRLANLEDPVRRSELAVHGRTLPVPSAFSSTSSEKRNR